MAEYLQQNEHELNQSAKAALRLLNLEPDDQFLYSLQLMNHGLLRKNYQLMPGNRVDLDEMVEDLLSDNPELAMKYLLESDQKGEFVELPDHSLKRYPNQLAQALLMILHNKMASTLDNYPTTPPAPIVPLGR